MELVCHGLVKERIALAVSTTFRALGKQPLTIPNEPTNTIITFVGDGLPINPMTAPLARAMATIRSSCERVEGRLVNHWNAVEQCRLVDEVMEEVADWWDENGGRLVSDAFVKRTGNKKVDIAIHQAGFPGIFKLMDDLVWKERLRLDDSLIEKTVVAKPEDSD